MRSRLVTQCALTTICWTFVVAWLEGNIPYFPIEISRVGALGYAYWVFVTGNCVTAFFLRRELQVQWQVWKDVVALSVILLAVFDAYNFRIVHALCAGFLFGNLLLYCLFYNPHVAQWAIFAYVIHHLCFFYPRAKGLTQWVTLILLMYGCDQ